jgi:hypothetical protein
MLNVDTVEHIALRRRELLAEAEHQRLVALALAGRHSTFRRDLALACYRLADWLDTSAGRYVQPADSGLEYWASPYLRA